MRKSPSVDEALTRLQGICSRSEKCKQDIVDKLRSWNFCGDCDSIIEQLEAEKYLDEKRFCGAYVTDKIKFSGWGRIKIRFYLRGKKISEPFIQEALSSFPEEEYLKIVEKELIKKIKMLKSGEKVHIKQKLLAFSVQRGYEADITYNILERIIDLL
jgi:regulatory protein